MGKTSDFKLRLTKWMCFATDNNSSQVWNSFLISEANLYIVLYVNLTEKSVILCNQGPIHLAYDHIEIQEFPKTNNVEYFLKIMQTTGKLISQCKQCSNALMGS